MLVVQGQEACSPLNTTYVEKSINRLFYSHAFEKLSGQPLDDHGHALAARNAHRLQTELLVMPLQ